MILEPGTFKVSDYRKAIPDWVKVAVVLRMVASNELPRQIQRTFRPVVDARDLRYDHRPPLQDRPYDTDAGDFIPPQNNPDHIEAVPSRVHDHRTFGRKPDAEKTVTTRGSDVGEAARTRDIKTTKAIHEAAMASKRGDYAGAARLLASAPKKRTKRHRWPQGRKIPSRPMQSQRRM